VDSVIGRIQATLQEEGLADNTVIILMGDNGYFLGERGYAGKWTMHELSIRVPMIIYDPRQPESNRGMNLEQMVLNVDVTPTILALAGVDIPDSYHGESLTSFYNGLPNNWRSSIFCEHRLENNVLLPKTECYRDDTWKFIRYEAEPELIELYNHKEDPNEIENLAYNSSYAGNPNVSNRVYNAATGLTINEDPTYNYKKASQYEANAIQQHGSLEAARKALYNKRNK